MKIMKKLLFPIALLAGLAVSAQQNVGIGTNDPKSKLDIKGGLTIGGNYAGVNTAPADGVIIEGRVGIGTNNPDAKAVLDVSASDKGMYLPRLNNTQAAALGATLNAGNNGMLIFNSDTRRAEYWDINTWKAVGEGAGGPPSGSAGGDLTGSYPAPTIAANAVTGAKVLDGSLTGADVQNTSIDLTTKVNNVLPVANGGTGVNTVTGIVQGNGSLPVSGIGSATANTYLRRNAANTGYEFGTIAYSNISGTPTIPTTLPPSGTAGGDLTGSYPNPTLTTTGVTANTYGNTTQVPVITVDAKGRVTGVTNTTISGVAPAGAAGGSLSGTYPNPGIATSAVTTTQIADGTIVNADIANATIDLTTKVTGVLPVVNGGTGVNTITGIMQGNGTSAVSGLTASAASQYLRRNAANTAYEFGQIAYGNISGTPTTLPPSGAAGGDLTGSYPNPSLAAVGTAGTYTKVTTDSKGRVISGTGLAAGDIPDLSASYIRNQTNQQSANYNVSGNGTVGGNMQAATYLFPAPPGDPSPVITARVVPAGQGASGERTELILFHSNDPGNGAGEDLITLRAPALRFQTYDNAGVGDVNNAAGSNDRMYITPQGNVGVGTTGPGAKLDVDGQVYARAGLKLKKTYNFYSSARTQGQNPGAITDAIGQHDFCALAGASYHHSDDLGDDVDQQCNVWANNNSAASNPGTYGDFNDNSNTDFTGNSVAYNAAKPYWFLYTENYDQGGSNHEGVTCKAICIDFD